MTPLAVLRLMSLAVADVLGHLVGRRPLLIPAAGVRGDVAALTTPDAMDGGRALDPGQRHSGWEQTVAARIALHMGRYRPGLHASRIRCPLLMVVCDQDRSTLPGPALRAAAAAPDAEVLHVEGRHYAPFLAAHEEVRRGGDRLPAQTSRRTQPVRLEVREEARLAAADLTALDLLVRGSAAGAEGGPRAVVGSKCVQESATPRPGQVVVLRPGRGMSRRSLWPRANAQGYGPASRGERWTVKPYSLTSGARQNGVASSGHDQLRAALRHYPRCG